MPSVREEAGANLSFKSLQLVLDLPHPPPRRRAFPRRTRLPPRRRRAHPQPGRRTRHEHRLAGCLQPRLEAGARRAGQGRPELLDSYNEERHPVAERLLKTTDNGFKLVVSDTPARRPAAHTRSSLVSPPSPCPTSASRGSPSAPCRKPASTTAKALCPRRWTPSLSRRPNAVIVFPGCTFDSGQTGQSKIHSRPSRTAVLTSSPSVRRRWPGPISASAISSDLEHSCRS